MFASGEYGRRRFAQPLILSGGQRRSFAPQGAWRIGRFQSLTDGSGTPKNGEHAAMPRKPSKSFLVSFEDLMARASTLAGPRIQKTSLGSMEIRLCDPPYTAQQYSRFYHILETPRWRLSELQISPGILTQGFIGGSPQSVFSKSAATKAFSAFSIAQQMPGAIPRPRALANPE